MECVCEPSYGVCEELVCEAGKDVEGGHDRIAWYVYRAMEEGIRKMIAVPGVHIEDKTHAPASAAPHVPEEVTPCVSEEAVPHILLHQRGVRKPGRPPGSKNTQHRGRLYEGHLRKDVRSQ